MRKLTERYLQSKFLRNITVMFSGNILAIIIPFILAPFITRIYSPADFAAVELFVKILTVLSVISALRMEFAIIIPRDETEMHSIVRLCFRIGIIATVISALIFIPLRYEVGAILENDQLADLLWFLPIGILASVAFNVLSQFLVRDGRFRELSSNKVISSLGNHGSKFLIGLKSATPFGLMAGHILGLILPVLALFRLGYVRDLLSQIRHAPLPVRSLFRKYRDFPLINASHSFFDEGQKALLLFLVSIYYGEITLGLFAITWRYLRMPVQVFGTSLASVLNERMAQKVNQGLSVRNDVVKSMAGLAATGLLPFGILLFYGEEIFSFVLSDTWAESGRYASIMAPWLYLNFVVSPITMLPIIVFRQRQFFVISVIGNLITLAGVIIFSIQSAKFDAILYIISSTNCLLLIFQIFWLVSISDGRKIAKTT